MPVYRLAIPCPLRRSFDYLPPASAPAVQPGVRVRAPFGNRELVGILLEVAETSALNPDQLKPATAILDEEPVLPATLFELVTWAAAYYQHPLGDAFSNALPVLLRQGEPTAPTTTAWRLTAEGKGLPEGALARARKQSRALALLQQQPAVSAGQFAAADISRTVLRELVKKGLAETTEISLSEHPVSAPAGPAELETPLALNREQRHAVDTVAAALGRHQGFLLEGITGSGKTEVYLQLIAHCLGRGEQALVLIPEIGLTPQTLARFTRRFGERVAVLHSGLTDHERLNAWRRARRGEADIVLGTRSAVFTPLARPGLLIVDEEHDGSFKQQDGFRYNARDLAVKRAHLEHIPILLGSATPSLESLHNALSQRYQHLQLTQRAGSANPPFIDVIDIRRQQLEEGFSPALLSAVAETISKGEQVLIFINRRGFAPALLCHDCGWVAGCRHCDARMTVHVGQSLLRCHHCEFTLPLARQCPQCKSPELDFRGPGTERCERQLKQLFPQVPTIRIDRDTTQGKTALENKLATTKDGQPCLLVGTQMLAKGHHLPHVTLVGIIDLDGPLFSPDFRGPERMGQLLEQVAGRAGRAEKSGRVLIQTHHPDHPLIQQLINAGYSQFARTLLGERQHSGLPPFSHLAAIRVDDTDLKRAEQFLRDLRRQLQAPDGVQLLGPFPAPMARRAGRFRANLLLQARSRGPLHGALKQLCALAEAHPRASRLRWSVDVDPTEV